MDSNPKIITLSEWRENIPETLHQMLNGQDFVILKDGIPFAVLSRITDSDLLARLKLEADLGHGMTPEEALDELHRQEDADENPW